MRRLTGWLDAAPSDRGVAVLLRHAEREALHAHDAGWDTPLTARGIRLARAFGSSLADRICALHTSPVPRCVQTVEAIAHGTSAGLPYHLDRRLGDPGVLVDEPRVAWAQTWERLGHEVVVKHLISRDTPLPGMAAPAFAVRSLVHHMLAASTASGLHLFCSHDSIVAVTAARMLGMDLGVAAWPGYLEGALFWRDGEDVLVRYRQHARVLGRDGADPAG